MRNNISKIFNTLLLGYVFEETTSSNIDNDNIEMDDQTRDWETIHKFDSFMVWEHNEIPSLSNNQILKSLEWLEISKAVSDPNR